MIMNKKAAHLSAEDFRKEVLESREPVLVDFFATWSASSRRISPVIDELAMEFNGRAKVAKVDVDRNPTLAAEYEVESTPTMVLFQEGEIVDRLTGGAPRALLARRLNALMG